MESEWGERGRGGKRGMKGRVRESIIESNREEIEIEIEDKREKVGRTGEASISC